MEPPWPIKDAASLSSAGRVERRAGMSIWPRSDVQAGEGAPEGGYGVRVGVEEAEVQGRVAIGGQAQCIEAAAA